MRATLVVIQIGLSATFLVAAMGKFMRTDEFRAALVGSRFPDGAVGVLTWAVPAVEIAIAAALVIGTQRSFQIALVAGAGLLLAFTAWMLTILRRGVVLRCGCFGASGAQVGWSSVARNAVLIALAVGGLIVARHTVSPLADPSVWEASTTVAAGLAVALAVAARTGFPALALKLESVRPAEETST